MAGQEKTGKKGFAGDTRGDEIDAAADFGIDISMLKDNLNRSYTQRVRRHQIALETVQKLRKAGQGRNVKVNPPE